MDPPGHTPWLKDTRISALNTSFGPKGYQEQEIACEALRNTDSANRTVDEVGIKADNLCVENVFAPVFGDRDIDDLRQNSSTLFPSEFYLDFLANQMVKALNGATSTYAECPDAPDELFERTGDDARS